MQFALENDDLRVRRTRRLIQDALIALTVEKGFTAVTVRDITERAMVNRSTFYRHYLDKYAVVEQYLDELQAVVFNAHVEQNIQPGPERLPAPLMALLRYIQQQPDFFRLMLGAGGDARFIARFRDIIEEHMRRLLTSQPASPDAPPLELLLNYTSCADVGAILWWLESGRHWTPEELAVWIGEISRSGIGLKKQT